MTLSSDPLQPAALRRRLLAWYRRNRRELPWRAPPGERFAPYPVWVSEVMLQQTRVVVAIPYYREFLRRFPNLSTLAAAPVSQVLAAWSGLGYYRRARQLHAAARLVVERHDGAFPLELAALRELPGVGAYTAGAILSIAANQPLAAVDGNVARIASRLTGRELTPARAQPLAQVWIAPRRAGEFNQAMMDLGATVCLPRAPLCGGCPLRSLCATRGEHVHARPRPRSRQVELGYVLARRGERVFLRQRSVAETQLSGMWELPEGTGPPGSRQATVRHAITTRIIRADVYAGPPRGRGQWFSRTEAASLPLTGLCRKILRRMLGWQLESGSARQPLPVFESAHHP